MAHSPAEAPRAIAPRSASSASAFSRSRRTAFAVAQRAWSPLEDVAGKALGARREGRKDPALESLEKVMHRELPVLIHTAGSEGVVNTARMWSRKYDTQCVISHGSFDGWKAGEGPLLVGLFAGRGLPPRHRHPLRVAVAALRGDRGSG